MYSETTKRWENSLDKGKPVVPDELCARVCGTGQPYSVGAKCLHQSSYLDIFGLYKLI